MVPGAIDQVVQSFVGLLGFMAALAFLCYSQRKKAVCRFASHHQLSLSPYS